MTSATGTRHGRRGPGNGNTHSARPRVQLITNGPFSLTVPRGSIRVTSQTWVKGKGGGASGRVREGARGWPSRRCARSVPSTVMVDGREGKSMDSTPLGTKAKREQAKRLILLLVREAGREGLSGKVRLFKAFYFAHLYYLRATGLPLTG